MKKIGLHADVARQWGREWRRFLPETMVLTAIAAARLTGVLQTWEWAGLDLGLRLRPSEAMDERVVIVGIREPDIRGADKYPVPDQTLAQILTQLQAYQPAAIGVDIVRNLPVAPGQAQLAKAFEAENVFGVEMVLGDQSGYTIDPPPGLPAERVGFADALADADGMTRRGLLGTLPDQVLGPNDYRLSLAVRLAERYLIRQGMPLDNGVQDPDAMRFGATELPRLHPNSGGYVGVDAGGNQMLINFRSGRTPFRRLSLTDLQRGVKPDWLRDKIVLIGYTAPSVKDLVYSTAIATDSPGVIYGVEAHAHVVSQIVNAALEGRPLLRAWWDGAEYGWIGLWSVIGVMLGRWIRSPLRSLLLVALASGVLVLGSYGLLLLGWWVPWVPALLGLGLNGVVVATFHRYDATLRSRLSDRQLIIDQTFETIHSGPLQTLAQTLRQLKGDELPAAALLPRLETLNQELRDVYDIVRREALTESPTLFLDVEQAVDLQTPLHETLYQVYTAVLERDFPGFHTLRLRVPKFEALEEHHLTAAQKRGLCRFLEEALCNVGKHGVGCTRLEVTCAQVDGFNIIRVVDNGLGHAGLGHSGLGHSDLDNSDLDNSDLDNSDVSTPSLGPSQPSAVSPAVSAAATVGMGTRQAHQLATQLRGRFQRSAQSPRGMCCELSWSAQKPWIWSLFSR